MTAKRLKLPPFSEVVELLEYDEETGSLTWLVDRCASVRAGDPAGVTIQRPHGYRIITIYDQPYKAHRICWFLATGEDPGDLEIVHINGDCSDNRFCNLRAVPSKVRRLDPPARKNSRSGVPGVSYDSKSGKWRARIRANGKSFSLGLYDSARDAEDCVKQAKKEMMKRAQRQHG